MDIEVLTATGPIPATFRSMGQPMPIQSSREVVQIASGPLSDWFIDPRSGEETANASAIVGAVPGDFVLTARVEVDFAATFDAGCLVVWAEANRWAKLAFEYSPQGQAMVVSVVTRAESDDCNSVVIDDRAVWLRIARLDSAYAFHYSTDGASWRFVRHFRLGGGAVPEIGFECQSPTGDGCTARFSSIGFSQSTLADLRNGI